MIIWGSTGKDKVVEEGDFYCPACLRKTEFDLHRISRYFTLYFIPLFPIGSVGEYVECVECGNEFDEQVLDLTSNDIKAIRKPWVCIECHNKNSPREHQCVACGEERD